MPFIPASLPTSTPTPRVWCFAFIGRELRLPIEEGSSLQPPDPRGAGG